MKANPDGAHALNPRQREAAGHFTGPMLVISGPGSGKTAVIVRRVIRLAEKRRVNPKKIAVITFTKAAAAVARSRLFALCGASAQNVSVTTFHALFYKIIRRFGGLNGAVLAEKERFKIVKGLALKHGVLADESGVRHISDAISRRKNAAFGGPLSAEGLSGPLANVFGDYERIKNELNKIDYDDMQILCARLLAENPEALALCRARFAFYLIDEFQDINAAQYECVKLLASPQNNVFAVGDGDQSIYGFRGTSPEFMRRFPGDFKNAKIVTLNVNYRSTDEIINFSARVIACGAEFAPREGTSRRGAPPLVVHCRDARKQAEAVADKIKRVSAQIPLSEIAVLFRENEQSEAIEQALAKRGIARAPRAGGAAALETPVAADILAYIALSRDISLFSEAARVINKPDRRINAAYVAESQKREAKNLLFSLLDNPKLKAARKDAVTELIFGLNKLKKLPPRQATDYIRKTIGYDAYVRDCCKRRALKPDSYFRLLDEIDSRISAYESVDALLGLGLSGEKTGRAGAAPERSAESVTLSTLHGAKGLEFKAVFIIGCVNGSIPHYRAVSEADLAEERRLFYVGLTRAKDFLYIFTVKYLKGAKADASPFLPHR